MAKDNVKQTDYGYEIIWAITKDYCSKILAFENPGVKTPMQFQKETEKSLFINNGVFRIRWIDTNDGQYYEKECKEGNVFHVPPMMPISIESLTAGASITQTSNGEREGDTFTVIPAANIGNNDNA